MRLLFLSLCLCSFLSPSLSAATGWDVMRQLNFRPLQLDLEGHDLSFIKPSGEKETLQEVANNRWTLLVFWATWCGPCQTELPLLEKLQQELKTEILQERFQLLAISTDSLPLNKINSFVARKKLTFPTGLDDNYSLAKFFQVSGIPVAFLLSPDKKVMGTFQGARDYSASSFVGKLKELIKLTGEDFEKLQEANLKEELPEVSLEAMQLSYNVVAAAKESEKRGFTHELHLLLTWPGDSSEYLVKTPQVAFPLEIVSSTDISSYSETLLEEGQKKTQTVFVYPFRKKSRLTSSGPYKIDPIEVNYAHRQFKSSTQTARLPGFDLNFSGFEFKLFGIPLVLFLAFFFFIYERKKRRGRVAISSEEIDYEKLQEEFDLLLTQSGKLREREYEIYLLEFYCRLQRLLWPEDYLSEVGKELQLIEKIRYANERPDWSMVSSYERQVKNLLAQIKTKYKK